MLTHLILALTAALPLGQAPAVAPLDPAVAVTPTDTARPSGRPAGCAPFAGVQPAAQATPPQARRLGELPPADHILTVFRTVERCPTPVIVRSQIGQR